MYLAAAGVGVHVGEWGAYNKTPHGVVLGWMGDLLPLYQEAGFGWALWNFRGAFGVLDSGRTDVDYEDWHGHQLDRELLDLLLEVLIRRTQRHGPRVHQIFEMVTILL